MKNKIILVVLILIIAVSFTACTPLMRFVTNIIDTDVEIENDINSSDYDNGLWHGSQPDYTVINGDYHTADGYVWAKLDETAIYGAVITLGCNDLICNYKQVPDDWKQEQEEDLQ